jgi:Tfp pilus assembly protein PilO
MKPTKDNVIMLSLLGVFVTGAIVFVYVPQGRTLNELAAEVAARKQDLESQTREAAVVPELFRRVYAMKARYPNFQRRLPKRKELGGFLREITGQLSDDGLSNQLIEPGSPSKEEFFNTLPIIMRFKGSYLSLGSFLERIDRMERLTRVQKLSVTSPKDSGGELDIELQLNIYFTES